MTGFDYLMAKGNPDFPDRHNAKNFDELCNAILTHRVQISINEAMTSDERRTEKSKLMWFSAATRPDATGEERRRKPENIAPCAFGMLDVDGCSPGALVYLLPVSARHSVLMYRTASYTDEKPRIRLVFELSRAVEAADRKSLGEALETMLMQAAGFTLVSVKDSRA
ncbi:DNA primase, partial [Salmonella enterica]